MHLPSKCCLSCSLLLSVFCFSLSISLMLSLHMCSGRTKLLISHPRCSKPSTRRRCRNVCVDPCAQFFFKSLSCLFLAADKLSWNRNPTEKFEIWHRLLSSAAVDAYTHLNTCSGNAIKGSNVCEARQPLAQNWFTELEKSRSRDVEERGKRKQVRFRAFEAQRKIVSEKTKVLNRNPC